MYPGIQIGHNIFIVFGDFLHKMIKNKKLLARKHSKNTRYSYKEEYQKRRPIL